MYLVRRAAWRATVGRVSIERCRAPYRRVGVQRPWKSQRSVQVGLLETDKAAWACRYVERDHIITELLRSILRRALIAAIVLGPDRELGALCDDALLSHSALRETIRDPLDRFRSSIRA